MVSNWRTNTQKIRCLSGGCMAKVFIHLVKVDEMSAYLMYKNFERKQNENQDECLRLGCYEYEWNGVLVSCKIKCF